MIWNEARERQLQDLWGQDLPTREIAKIMGAGTRNVIIGKAHRLGLPKRTKAGKPVEKSKQTPRKPRIKKVNPNWVERAPLVPDHVPPAEGPVGGLPLGSLADSKCHAIIGVLAAPNGSSEPAYCGGDKVPDKNWCAHHFALYTQPARRR